MNKPSAESHRIQPHHLERSAYVYVRQSSLRQVAEHLESQRRQYERVDWALAAGWPRERIEVIDEDQGKSGATAKVRPGFARLVAAVAQGEVGVVVALEVTRLARNSPDWHHLLYPASTAPAHRRSMRRKPNPRPPHLRPCPDCARECTTAPLRLASRALRPPPPS